MAYKSSADIVFLLDVTSGMRACLANFYRCIDNLLANLTDAKTLDASAIGDWRMRVLGFRDREADGNQWWVEHPFTSDASEVRSHLQGLECKGGGDEPESLLDAPYAITQWPVAEKGVAGSPAQWRHRVDAYRIVVIVSDASFKSEFSTADGSRGQIVDAMVACQAARLRIYLFAPFAPAYEELACINGLEWEPLGELGGDFPLAVMRDYFAEKAADKTWLFKSFDKQVGLEAPLPEGWFEIDSTEVDQP
jgi:hypothetical protein